MKVIPAVTKIVVVEPEKYILEPGDRAEINDLSYLLEINDLNGVLYKSWFRVYSSRLDIGTTIEIVLTNLKVPCPANDKINIFELDSNKETVYLDTVICDDLGHYWLTQSKYLTPKGIEHE